MPRLPRFLLLLGILVLIPVRLLPPWEVCWHGDGSVCLDARTQPCCDEEEPEPDTELPCEDCSDLTALAALRTEHRADEVTWSGSIVSLASLSILSPGVQAFAHGSCAQGPPSALPPHRLGLPLLC